ncbi:Ppx/GppA phosphatase family protein [Mesobacillus foraminis]|uniref:Ppx/GppA phosphatase family protein n=1 Tax=Mesobacillus foraminis TaxID=279826 RepID=UPI00214C05B0|nr:exopolyphosphatase [Mesobacillus foraminis]
MNPIAVIDLGSNSVQFAIYHIDKSGKYFSEVKRFKVTHRLINYLNSQGNITKEGMALILITLKDFHDIGRKYGVSRIFGICTAVIRNSANKEEVLAEIQRNTAIPFSVLSEYEEAYYGYLGVMRSTNLRDGIIIDIGGGSTEITLFRNREMVQYHSFPFGAVNLNEAFTKGEKVTKQHINQLRYYLAMQLQSMAWLSKTGLPVIGIGGSAKNLSRIYQAKKETKPLSMTLDDVKYVFTRLSSLNVTERSKIKGLSKKRKDIIIPAVQMISILMEVVDSPYFIYCNQTVRDGFIYNILENAKHTSD